MIRLELPFLLPLWNQSLRKHYRVRSQERNRLAWEVRVALTQQRISIPTVPFAKVRIRVERHTVGNADPDGLSAKALLDVLQPQSHRHPAGLGIITNDNGQCLTLELAVVKVPTRAAQKTVVLIEEETA